MSPFIRETSPASTLCIPSFSLLMVLFLGIFRVGESIYAQTNIDRALDTPGLQWSSNGLWFLQSEVSDDGEDALASVQLDPEESASLALTITGPVSGSFWWKVSSEKESDFLYFVIDGEIVRGISGEVDWTQVEFEIQAGTHEIHWIYEKDGEGAAGADQAWLDRVEVSFPTQAAERPTLSIARGGVRGVVISWPAADAVGYDLQASPVPNLVWSPLPKAQIVYDAATDRESFTLNDVGHFLFFRLAKPQLTPQKSRDLGPFKIPLDSGEALKD